MRITPSTSQNRNDEPELVLDQARQADGDQEEQHDREQQRDHDGARPHRLGDLLGLRGLASVLALFRRQLRVGGYLQRRKPIAIDPPSATTPRMIGSLRTRWRLIAESSG